MSTPSPERRELKMIIAQDDALPVYRRREMIIDTYDAITRLLAKTTKQHKNSKDSNDIGYMETHHETFRDLSRLYNYLNIDKGPGSVESFEANKKQYPHLFLRASDK